jgi:hypothetical protein
MLFVCMKYYIHNGYLLAETCSHSIYQLPVYPAIGHVNVTDVQIRFRSVDVNTGLCRDKIIIFGTSERK